MGWNPLNDLRYEVEKERAQQLETGLNESPGLWNSLMGTISGATQEGVDNKRSAMASADAKRQYGSQYETATGKPWRDGMSSGEALRAIDDANHNRTNTRWTTSPEGKAFTAQLQQQSRSHDLAVQGLNAQIASTNATNTRLLQQGQQSHQLALMQMADSKDQRALEFEYQKMRDRKADQQYNERMEQMDRKDRKMAMQSLAAGLASLGAAFAF